MHKQNHREIGLLSIIWFVFSISLTTLADHPGAPHNIGHEITSLPEVLLITYSDKALRTMSSEIDITFTCYLVSLLIFSSSRSINAIPHKR